MALIVCLECRKEVSDKAGKCPHCGAPIASPTSAWRPAASGSPMKGRAIRAARYVLFAAVLGAAWWIWQAATSGKRAPLSAGLTAAFRDPVKVADERVALKEGQHVSYPFALKTDSRVHVRVIATGDALDVMLMPRTEAERFRQAGGSLFGGQYAGRQDLSSRQVGWLDKTEVVTKGDWALVVMRPKESSPGKEGNAAEIAVTVY